MRSRRRCLLVAIWLTLPIAMSLELSTAFQSEVVLARCGVLTAALNLPGFLLVYLLAYQSDWPAPALLAAGDALFYVPAIYAVLRWSSGERGLRRRRARRIGELGTRAARLGS